MNSFNILKQFYRCVIFNSPMFQIKLDSLNDFFANISSHVASIEDERPQFKQYVQSTFSRINAELAILKNNSARNSRLIAELQSSLVQPKPQQSNIIDKLFNESIKNNGASADQQVWTQISFFQSNSVTFYSNFHF